MSHNEAVFGFYIPTVTLMGIGAHKQLGEQIKVLEAKKPFLVTDKGITDAGLTSRIVDLIKQDTGADTIVFDDTVPNPTDTNVADGVKAYEESGSDMIITLGGGSPHDCGKGIGIVLTNGGTIHDYEGVDQSIRPMPPFIAINTTAGTASEMTRFNLIARLDRFADIAIAMGEPIGDLSKREAAEEAITSIQTLSRDIGIPANLTELGVKKEDLPIMAENAQKDACGVTNPRRPSLDDVIDIYTAAL